jgi:hypothetical protein
MTTQGMTKRMDSPNLDRPAERQFVEIDVERVAWDEDYRDALKQVLAVEATLDARPPEPRRRKTSSRETAGSTVRARGVAGRDPRQLSISWPPAPSGRRPS